MRLRHKNYSVWMVAVMLLSSGAVYPKCQGAMKGKALARGDVVRLLQTQPDARHTVNLCGVVLKNIDLSQLDLNHVNLSDSNLSKANLTQANLAYANLNRATIRGAILKKADLTHSRLMQAKLQESDLTETNLHHANLQLADFSGARLRHANLDLCNAKYANFNFSDLSNSSLIAASLYRSHFEEANLTKANLFKARLTNTNFNQANLSYANFTQATLYNATVMNAQLKGANFNRANLLQLTYQPKLDSLPDLIMLASAKNFHQMKLDGHSGTASLTELRTAYRDIGLRSMERTINTMLQVADMHTRWDRGGLARVESVFRYVLFYLTSNFGAEPSRPLKIFLAFIALFTLPYLIALTKPSRHNGLFVTWTSGRFTAWDRLARQVRHKKLIHLLRYRSRTQWQDRAAEFIRILRIASYFSLVNAFQIGWADFNLSTWISRMQTRDYSISCKGWVRFVAGIQSLISAYLLLLWAFCYFGRPFYG